jgi:hypothetical protein
LNPQRGSAKKRNGSESEEENAIMAVERQTISESAPSHRQGMGKWGRLLQIAMELSGLSIGV